MEYRVLARKYRPTNFDDLIGQEVLVRTLANAIASGRVAHAFLLTGIRGVGKTTTARIIARALNCIGEDGKSGPTISPCGVCTNCTMISQDRHVDVLEMDAASHTGVNDIRELIDTVRYLPTSARYKIYIIDEVHMLSNSAFNALLKTLEEPPPHVKFIFATTEARKIPVTILSRCQRFDLKRIDNQMLAQHLANIAAKESVTAEKEALDLIALAAEGSVRDSLSLLDQAIARGTGEGASGISTDIVRQMLGSTDHAASFRLIETLMKGEVATALELIQKNYTDGADPLLMVQDYLEITHLITRVKVAPQALSDVTLSQHDREAAKKLADGLSMASLARLWQMLLKGLGEIRQAPSPLTALEMLVVRIGYAAHLPTPAEIIRDGVAASPTAALREHAPAAAPTPATAKANLELIAQPEAAAGQPANFADIVKLFEKNREIIIATQLKQDVRLVSLAPGRLELRLTSALPRDFIGKVGDFLGKWTGEKWQVVISSEEGESTLQQQAEAHKQQQEKSAAAHPLVSSVLEQFPGAKLVGVKSN